MNIYMFWPNIWPSSEMYNTKVRDINEKHTIKVISKYLCTFIGTDIVRTRVDFSSNTLV